MVLKNSIGILLFTVLLFMMFLMIPRRGIREFLGVGAFGGFSVAILLVLLMQNQLGLWLFHQVDFFNIAGIPVFLSAAWFSLEIFFCHLLSYCKNLLRAILLIIALPLGATLFHYLLIANGMLFYRHWNLFFTFLVSLGIHLVIGYYLYITRRLGNLRYS